MIPNKTEIIEGREMRMATIIYFQTKQPTTLTFIRVREPDAWIVYSPDFCPDDVVPSKN
jgi:hypothetical protein